MKYTSIDFETANASPLSACSVGIVLFEDGIPIQEIHTLIRPPKEFGDFNWRNTRIHGIKKSMVADAPTFDQVWQEIMRDCVEGQLVVCHNASFDTAVLRRLLEYYKLDIPEFSYICTVKVSQKVWPDMENHKLDTVSRDLHIDLHHHEALSDSRACGLILAQALRDTGCVSVAQLAEKIGMQLGHVQAGEAFPCSVAKQKHRIRKRNHSKPSLSVQHNTV